MEFINKPLLPVGYCQYVLAEDARQVLESLDPYTPYPHTHKVKDGIHTFRLDTDVIYRLGLGTLFTDTIRYLISEGAVELESIPFWHSTLDVVLHDEAYIAGPRYDEVLRMLRYPH